MNSGKAIGEVGPGQGFDSQLKEAVKRRWNLRLSL